MLSLLYMYKMMLGASRKEGRWAEEALGVQVVNLIERRVLGRAKGRVKVVIGRSFEPSRYFQSVVGWESSNQTK